MNDTHVKRVGKVRRFWHKFQCIKVLVNCKYMNTDGTITGEILCRMPDKILSMLNTGIINKSEQTTTAFTFCHREEGK
jgi:hypothetical protein